MSAGLTRFYDRQSGRDGPVSGSLVSIPLNFDTALGASATQSRRVDFPAGMKFKVTDIVVTVGTVVANTGVTVQVGTTTGGVDVLAAVAATTAATTDYTPLAYTEVAGGSIDVKLVTGATDSIALPICVTLIGHVSAPSASV